MFAHWAVAYLVADYWMLSMFILLGLSYLLPLSLFGTALPATVARDGTYHLSQGLRVALPMMGKLLLGPGIVFLASSIASLNYAPMLMDLRGPAMWAFSIAKSLLGFLSSILTVAILCDTYRKTRPAPDTA